MKSTPRSESARGRVAAYAASQLLGESGIQSFPGADEERHSVGDCGAVEGYEFEDGIYAVFEAPE